MLIHCLPAVYDLGPTLGQRLMYVQLFSGDPHGPVDDVIIT